MEIDIYLIAQASIEQHGDNAIGFALRETMRFVREEDVKEAGRWLVIGQAVEMLWRECHQQRDGIDESVTCRRLPIPRPSGPASITPSVVSCWLSFTRQAPGNATCSTHATMTAAAG